MINYRRWISLVIFLMGCSNEQPAANHNRGFDEAGIELYNSSERFNYDRKITKKANPLIDFLAKVVGGIAWFLNTIFGYLMIALLVALLIWILFRYVNQERMGSLENPEVLRIIDESKINDIDFNRLIGTALTSNDYRLAVRYTFLNVLQMLSLNKLISVRGGKTNYEYHNELPAVLKPKYRQILLVFENVWYGEFDGTSTIYSQINNNAIELQELIKNTDA